MSSDASAPPPVTVLMSVYNGIEYLDEAIESIVNQTFSEFEFLIIDDASTDGSRETLKNWEDQDQRIRLLFHEENRGLGYALHEGVKVARGDWIVRMDDDDVALSERIEKQLSYVSSHPEVDILGTWTIDVDEEGEPIRKRTYPTTHKEIARLIWTNPIVHPTAMLRKEAIREIGSYDPSVEKRQDYELWFRCLERGLRFANLPEVLLKYRFTGEYYERNDWKVAWNQAKMGWKGCWRVGASPLSYVGVSVPLLRSLLPRKANAFVHRQLHRIDPRRNETDAD